MSYRGLRPRLEWGAAFANHAHVAYALDSANAYSQPRAGSEMIQLASGTEIGWLTGHDQYLTGEVRHVPEESTLVPRATGWNGATGWRAALEWLRAKNVGRFYPDGRNLAPNPGIVGANGANVTSLTCAAVNSHSNSTTVATYDAYGLVARHVRNGVAGPDTNIGTQTTTATVASGTVLQGQVAVYIPTACSLTALSIQFEGGVTGATTGSANLSTRDAWQVLTCSATSSVEGAKSLVLRQTSATDAQILYSDAWQIAEGTSAVAYVPPYYVSCYLVDDEGTVPGLERSARRRFSLTLRSSDGSVFVGY